MRKAKTDPKLVKHGNVLYIVDYEQGYQIRYSDFIKYANAMPKYPLSLCEVTNSKKDGAKNA